MLKKKLTTIVADVKLFDIVVLQQLLASLDVFSVIKRLGPYHYNTHYVH